MTKLRNTWLPLLSLLALLAFASVSCGPGGDRPPPSDDEIEVRIIVDGPGRVIQGPIPYECRDDCLWTGDGDVSTSFTAVPAPEYAFVGWEGACDVLENPCTRTFEDGDTIKATFALHALRLDLTGDGEGAFTVTGGGITATCDADCGLALPALAYAIQYEAQGTTGTTLGAWGGACQDATLPDYCLVQVSGSTDVSKRWVHPPVAADDAYATTRNAPLTVDAPGVLTNDDDTPGDVLTAVVVTGVQHGSLTLVADGGFGYTPDPDFADSDTFTYRARDAFGNLSNPATVTITVANRPPEAVGNSYATALNTPLTVPAPGVLANDRDPDGDVLTLVDQTPVSDGTLELEPDGGFTYTPEPDFIGPATFTYRVSDGLATSDPATVTIGVGLDAPLAADDTYGTLRNQLLTVPAPGVLDNDIDPGGEPLVAEPVDDASQGTLVLAPDGSFTYEPDEDFVGTDTFTYTASNGETSSVVATVTIDVTNGAPIANDDAYATTRNEPLTVNAANGLLANDTDPDDDALIIDDFTQPAIGTGTVTVNDDGSFTYTPTTDFVGTATFTYTATDGLDTSNTATVTITVSNEAPVASDDAYTTDVDTPLSEPAPGVLANDTDADGDPLSATLVDDVTNGTLDLAADGSFTYTPDPAFAGIDTFTYVANDGFGDSNTATVTITVEVVGP